MPTIVQTFQGRVTGLWGQASIRAADGKMHPLKLGDIVHQGDVILTTQDGIVRLSPEGSDVELAGGPADAKKPAIDEIDRVISALNDADPQAATAAGVAGGDGGGDLTPGLRVDRVSEGLAPFAMLQGSGSDESSRTARDVSAAAETGAPVPPPQALNSTPIAVNDSAATAINTPLTVAVLANDSDRDGNPLTLTGATLANPAQGSVVVNSDGTLTFTPAANVSGPIAITYTVSDGQGGSASASLTVSVGANTTPSGANAAVSLAEDSSYVVATADFGFSDPDAGQTLAAVRIDSIPAAGSLLLDGVAVTAGTVVSAADIAAGHLTFVPADNANGAPYASFGFSVQDSAGAFDAVPNTINFSVTPVNDAPIARNDLASTPINTPATIAVLGNDSDTDGDALAVTGATLSDPTLGSVTVNPDGTLGFTPASNVSGSVVIHYSIADPSGATSTATVTVNVGSNAPPAGADATVMLAEDTTRAFMPADFGFSDADAGQTLANVRIDTLPAAGTLTFNGTAVVAGQVIAAADLAQLVFAPAPNGNGTAYAGFTFSVQDSAGAYDPAPNAITFSVTPVNDAPVAYADIATATEDTPLAGNVLGNDSDIDGDTLTVTQFSIAGTTYAAGATATLAGVGTLVVNANGDYAFTPGANYHGPVPQATYTISDGTTTASSTLGIGVTPVNDAPIAQDDLASTPINTALANIAVLANDGDVDGDTLSVSSAALANPALGSISINPDGTLNFTPAGNVFGPVAINYTIADGQGGTSSAVLTVNVGSNTPPAGADATVAIAEDTSKTFAAADFGFGDVDAGQTLANVRIDTLPAAGTLTFNGTAVLAGQVIAAADLTQLVFTPAPNGNGTAYAGFTFSVQDSAGAFDTTPNTITIDVAPVNDAPVANADVGTATEDTPLAGNVLTNDTDIDGDALTVSQFNVVGTTYAAGSTASLAGIGTLQINADGSYAFTPAANYNGPVPQVTYTLSDGSTTASATLSLSVDSVNDTPVAQNDLASTPINTALASIDVLGNDSDVDGGTLSVSSAALANPALGSVSINPDGTLNFTPASNVFGPVVVNYTISDGQGGAASAALTITVGANSPPAGANSLVTIAEDSSKTFDAADFGYADADAGQTFANVRIDTLPGAGTLTLNGSAVTAGQVIAAGNLAQLVFTPAADASGSAYASFTFSVQDSAGAFDPAPNTITIDVTSVTDGFTDADEAVAVNEDSILTGTVLGGTSSVDGPVVVTQFAIGATTYAAGATAQIAGVGSLTMSADGTYSFTPASDYNGPVPAVTYTVTDGTSTDTSTLTIAVTPVADPALISGVASGASVEDTTLIASGKLDVTDPDAGEAGFQPQTNFAGTHGTFSIDAAGNWTYTLNNADPAVQALGQGQALPNEVFTVRSVDGTTASVTVTITGTDDAPVISTGSGAVTENSAPTATGTLSATDVDDPALAFVPATISGNYGSLTLLANGQWTYTLDTRAEPLAQNQVVSEPITVQLTDGSTTSVMITVTGTNDAAVITGTAVGTVTEDTTLVATGSLAATDIDSAATFTPQTVALTYGNFVIDAAGHWTYTLRNADANVQALTSSQHPTESVTVATADGTQQQITITVNGANEAPSAIVTPASGAEDSAGIPITLTGSDVDGALASFAVTVLPANGTLLYAGSPVTVGMLIPASANSASLSFMPNANWNGSTSLTFSTTDNEGASSASVTQSITVTAVNDVPVALNDAFSTAEDTPVTFDVLGNDSDVDGDALAITQIDGNPIAIGGSVNVTGGSITLNTNGTLTFSPASNYNGSPSFTYTVSDGALTSTATVNGTVSPANDAPLGVSDTASAVEAGGIGNATPGSNPSGNVLTNDIDPDAGDAKSVSAVSGTSAGAVGGATAGSYGTLVLNADGSYGYTVDNNNAAVQALRTAGDTLADTFTYTVRDAAGATSSTTLTMTIAGANDAPVATVDVGAVNEGATLNVAAAGGVLANDSDVDAGDTKAVSAVAFGAASGAIGSALTGTYGTLTLNADGSYSYQATQPAATALAQGQSATESFSYTTLDAAGAVSTSTLTFTVAGVNNTPVAAPDTNTVSEDTPLVVAASPTTGLLANDSDPDAGASLTITQFSIAGDPTTYAAGSAATIAGVGTLTINANGSYGFTPAADYNGPVPVASYAVSDGITTTQSTLTLTVAPINDAPVLSLDADHSHNTVAVQAIGGLFNTGQSSAGAALAAGTLDPHYTLVAAPAGSTLTAAATGLPGSWVANDANSTWIGSTGNQPTGVYQYQTSFTLQAGADPRSVHIAFDLSSDNNLRDIQVNGVSTGFTSNLQYAQFTHVELDGGTAAFGNGVNTITFVVDNRDPGSPASSGPTGLRIDNISGNVAVVTPDAVLHQGDYAAIYVEGTPVAIGDNDVRIQDVDSATLQSATITLTNPQTGDVLQLGTLPAGITASVNAAGTLVTLSGSATLAAYEAAIRAVQFNNTSDSPSGAIDRLVSVVVNDGFANSNTATTTIHVVPVNDAPTLDLDANNSAAPGTSYAATYVENSAAIAIVDTDRAIQDADSTTLHSATIHITNPQAGDVLSASSLPSGITAAVYDPVAGLLTLSGTATLAAYQTALAAVRFSNGSENPSAVSRTIEITVNDGSANSNVAVSTISVVPVNDAPVANPNTGSGAEDSVQTGNVLANDTDVDSASLSVSQFSIGASTYAAGTTATIAGVGTLVIGSNGAYTFTPVADWNGSVPTVNYTTSDGALTATSTLALSVTAAADVVNDAISTNEDTAIVFNPISGSNETSGADNFENAGRTLIAVGTPSHGSVSFAADGTITYTPAANYNGPDSFTYTVNSGGVTETASIGVNVAPVNDAPVVGTASVRVSEEGLSGANADSTGATDTTNLTTASGSIALSDVDNAALTVTLGAPATALASAGTAITWQSSNGGHTLIGKAGTTTIITASIDNSGNYTVTLSGPVDHPDTSAEDVKSFGITVNVSDGSVTSTGTLTVGIEDDRPVIGTPASAVLYDGAGTRAEGDLHLNIGADSGSSAKVVFAGTSVDANGFITANRVDPTGTVVGSGFLTYNGSKLHYVSGSDGSLSAVDASNTTVYTVTGDVASGHYGVAMLHALDPVQVTTAVFGSVSAGNNGTYSFSDGTNTFDVAATGYSSNVLSTVNTNANVFGVANNFVDGGERLVFDVSAHGSGNPSQVTGIGITAQGLGAGESLTWSAYDASHNLVGQGVVNGSGNNSTHDTAVTLTSANFSGGSFSSIEFGGGANTSYKLQLDSLTGNSEFLHQRTSIAVHGTDSDGDPSATQAVALTFNANTTLTGTSGEDALAGGSFNDALNGAAGSDLLIGGKGDDTLIGGAGADVFKWGLSDQGTNAAKAADTVTDFDNSPTGDKLDLRDLLVGEHSDQGNLANFLHFSVSAGSTKIEISSSGGFAGGTYSAAAVDQTITLSGVDLKGSFTNDNQIINDLITRNKLVVDH